MSVQNDELVGLVTRFAESGWDVIDAPSRVWLGLRKASEEATAALVAAVQQADRECGSCGCEMDPLYKRALELLSA